MTTQKAFFSYEEVIDLHTETGRVSVIGIHTPTGDTPRKLCPGFFDQFRKYKYLGCSVALVPAATLPADPLSVSYEAGEPTIDPRDMLNPILWHGCHGNDLGNILNRLYSSGLVSGSDVTQLLHSDSLDLMNMMNVADIDGALNILESLYYRALTDKTWKKANMQRGFRKGGLRPRIYSLATNMQLQSVGSLGGGFNAPGPFGGDIDALNDEVDDFVDPNVNPVRYFTPRTVPLGWLDTRNVVPYVAGGEIGTVDGDDFADTVTGLIQGKTVWMELPKVFMGVILLPPAYKTEMYFRMVINHYFAFAGFRGISMSNEMLEMPPNYDNWNDLLTSGESVDPEPEPEPEPVPSYSLTLRVLGHDKFKGFVYDDGSGTTLSQSTAVTKENVWSLGGGFDTPSGTEPYGTLRFDGSAYIYYWDSAANSYKSLQKSNSQVTSVSLSDVWSEVSFGCTTTNLDADKLDVIMKLEVTDHIDS